MEVHMKQRCGTEFLLVEKNGTHCIHQSLLNFDGDQAVAVSTLRVGGAFQQWQQQKWVTSTGAEVYRRSMQALVHGW